MPLDAAATKRLIDLYRTGSKNIAAVDDRLAAAIVELEGRVAKLEGAPTPSPTPTPTPTPTPPTQVVGPKAMKSGETLRNVIIDGGGGAARATGLFFGDGVKGCIVENVIVRNCKLGINGHPGHQGGHRLTDVYVHHTGDTAIMDQAHAGSTYTRVVAAYAGIDENGNATGGAYGVDASLGVHGWYMKSQSTFNACKALHCKKNGFSIRTHTMTLLDCEAENAPILVAFFDDKESLGPAPHGHNRIERFKGRCRNGQMGVYIDGGGSTQPTPIFDIGDNTFTALSGTCKGIESYRPVHPTGANAFLGPGSWSMRESYKAGTV